jgi:peroxiredoxin
MAPVPSTMRALGTPAPDFDLPDAAAGGTRVKLSDFRGRPALVVMFICNHCPYVKWVRAELARIGREYQAKGAAVVAINSNDIASHPDDAPEKMAEEARAAGYTFPYLFDETQDVAKAFGAACTPDFYVFDASMKLAYRGQLDDSRPTGRSTVLPGAGLPVTGKDLRAAIDAVLAGRAAPEPQRPSIGCNIKWKKGNEPAYFTL